MSPSESPVDAIESRAAQWILERDRGDFPPERREALEEWLSADARHRQAYLRFDQAWRLSAGLKAWRPLTGYIDPRILGDRHPSRSYLPLAVAASVLLALLAALTWALWPAGTLYSTAIGGYQRIVLDDGSVLQLNTNTRLRVQLGDRQRLIGLERGEAYFEVAHDPARPFIVMAGNRRITAVGTQFSVRRDRDDVSVSVTEGTVRVAGQPLAAGSVAEIGQAGTVRVEHHSLPEVESQLTWRTGTLVFHDRPLSEVIAEVNRYHPRQIIIADPALARLPFGGNLRSTDQQSLIDALRTLNIRVQESADTITLSGNPP